MKIFKSEINESKKEDEEDNEYIQENEAEYSSNTEEKMIKIII